MGKQDTPKTAGKKTMQSYECRVKIDEGMGDIFTWVSGITPRLRSREVSALIRLAFEMRKLQGAIHPLHSAPTFSTAEIHKAPPAVEKPMDIETAGAKESHAAMQAHGFDLDFLTPSTEANMH